MLDSACYIRMYLYGITGKHVTDFFEIGKGKISSLIFVYVKEKIMYIFINMYRH
jgi:hypothetical protein